MAAAEDSKNVSRKTFVLCFDGTGNKFRSARVWRPKNWVLTVAVAPTATRIS